MRETDVNITEQQPRVFWSWQNDQSPATCRSFIRDCLADAILQIASDFDLSDAERPSIDHDTMGERGMVDITSTILTKISKAAVFVADLTPVGQTDDGKWLPNPNVMIELGWAMHRPGWERVIGVLNMAHGANEADLPFDIRQRRIITYVLPNDTKKPTRRAVRDKLTQELREAILINLDEWKDEMSASVSVTGVEAKSGDRSIWATAKPMLIHGDAFGGVNRKEIGIPDVARAYFLCIC